MAERLHLSPNDVEEMYVDLAEDQIDYWVEQADGNSPSRGGSGGSSSLKPKDLAAQFGGQFVKVASHG